MTGSFRRGEVPLAVLALLGERPLRADQVSAEVTRRFGPRWRAAAIEVEPAVAALAIEGLIEPSGGGYRATATGLAALDARRKALAELHSEVWWSADALTVAVAFTDVVGSTAWIDELGEAAAHARRRRHFALLREAVSRHGGREVKSLGDGLMVAFVRAGEAVAAAAAMQRTVAACEDPVQLRIGIDWGDVIREDEDLFGRPVVVARRLCDAAEAGQILVSEDLRRRAGGPGFAGRGRLALKGVREPVDASAVSWASRERPAAVPAPALQPELVAC